MNVWWDEAKPFIAQKLLQFMILWAAEATYNFKAPHVRGRLKLFVIVLYTNFVIELFADNEKWLTFYIDKVFKVNCAEDIEMVQFQQNLVEPIEIEFMAVSNETLVSSPHLFIGSNLIREANRFRYIGIHIDRRLE